MAEDLCEDQRVLTALELVRETSMPTVLRNERATALTYLVGQSRAYLQQLELARRELGDLKAAASATWTAVARPSGRGARLRPAGARVRHRRVRIRKCRPFKVEIERNKEYGWLRLPQMRPPERPPG